MAVAQDKRASELTAPVSIADTDVIAGYRPGTGGEPNLDIRMTVGLVREPIVAGLVQTVLKAGADRTGVADSSAAFAALMAEGKRFRVPSGTYKWSSLPSLSGVTSIDIEGDGEAETIIELAAGAATKSIPTGALTLLRAKGVQFKGFNTVWKVTGDLGRVELDGVKLRNSKCLMADDDDDYNGSGTPEDYSIDHFRMVGCDIDAAECGVSCVVQVKSAYVTGNIITNLTHDDDFFGIRLGNDSEIEQSIWPLQGKMIIHGNIVSGMINTLGSDVIMNGILAMGYDVAVSNNMVSSLSGSATNCEGIYVKAHRTSVHDNKVYNAGMNQGGICIKGRATGMAASTAPVGTYVNVHDNHVEFASDYDTSHSHIGIHIEVDQVFVHHNTVIGANLYGIEWNSQDTATPTNIRIEDNDISKCIARGIQCTGHADGLFVKRNRIHDWVASAGVFPFGIVFNDSATTAAVAGRNLRCLDNEIDIRLGAASTEQLTGIACAWSTAVFDDIVIGGGKIVCTHDSAAARGLDVNCSGTGGFGKTKFTPIEMTCTSPYTSFTDANFRPTELDFAGRVRMVTTDATLGYAVQMTLADGKSIVGFVKARGVQTSGTPSGSTIITHEQRNTGYQSAGTLTMGTATVTQAPTAGISGWASAFNATSANVRIGVDGVAATTIEWWLEWDIWCK